MAEFWIFLKSDAGRVFLAILAILISATITTTVFFLNRKKKSVTYRFLTLENILTVKKQVASRVQILFDGLPVENVAIVLIRVANTGTEPIKPADFVRPISFSVPTEINLLDSAVSKQQPERLGISLIKEDQAVIVSPVLLNAKEAFVIRLLVSDFKGQFTADARIEGCQFKKGMPDTAKRIIQTVIIGVLLSIVTALGLQYVVVHNRSSSNLPSLVVASLLPLSFASSFFAWRENKLRYNLLKDYL